MWFSVYGFNESFIFFNFIKVCEVIALKYIVSQQSNVVNEIMLILETYALRNLVLCISLDFEWKRWLGGG